MTSDKYIYELTALENLFKRYYKPLRAYAYRFVNDMDLSEDIVQDVFFELWSRRDTIEFDGEVKSYLFKSVYNRSVNLLNKKHQISECELDSTSEAHILEQYLVSSVQTSEQSLLLKELETEITSFIGNLPPQCQKIFMLSRSYGLKNREIAEQLNITIKAVEKQIGKALFGLKEHLLKKGLISLFFWFILVSTLK